MKKLRRDGDTVMVEDGPAEYDAYDNHESAGSPAVAHATKAKATTIAIDFMMQDPIGLFVCPAPFNNTMFRFKKSKSQKVLEIDSMHHKHMSTSHVTFSDPCGGCV